MYYYVLLSTTIHYFALLSTTIHHYPLVASSGSRFMPSSPAYFFAFEGVGSEGEGRRLKSIESGLPGRLGPQGMRTGSTSIGFDLAPLRSRNGWAYSALKRKKGKGGRERGEFHGQGRPKVAVTGRLGNRPHHRGTMTSNRVIQHTTAQMCPQQQT